MAARFGARLAGTLVAMGLAGSSSGVIAGEDPLAGYRWRSRVLVLAAPGPSDAHLRAQREALASAHSGVKARDLVVVEAVGLGAEAVRLRQRLGLSGTTFRAVLVGKDGGAKLTSDAPIPPQALFATIDAMPMRRDEMHRAEMGRR